jgi:hypothetical protein
MKMAVWLIQFGVSVYNKIKIVQKFSDIYGLRRNSSSASYFCQGRGIGCPLPSSMLTNTWAYTTFGDSSIDFRVYDECFKPKPRLRELFLSQNAIDEESWINSLSTPRRRIDSASRIRRSASLDFSVDIKVRQFFKASFSDHCGRRIRRWRQKKS